MINYKSIVLLFLFSYVFQGCGGGGGPTPKISPSEFEISGYILDDCDDEGIEGVNLEIGSVSFICGGIITDSDGFFLVNATGCNELNEYLLLNNNPVDLSISFVYDKIDVGFEENSMIWNNKMWDDIELSFECPDSGCGNGPECQPGKQCISRKCVDICNPMFEYLDIKTGKCIEKEDRIKRRVEPEEFKETVITLVFNYLRVKDILIDDISWAMQAEDDGSFFWDDEDKEIIMTTKNDIKREILIKYEFEGEEYENSFYWTDGKIDNMKIKWNGSEFKSSWEQE